jgi:hypothetical protein
LLNGGLPNDTRLQLPHNNDRFRTVIGWQRWSCFSRLLDISTDLLEAKLGKTALIPINSWLATLPRIALVRRCGEVARTGQSISCVQQVNILDARWFDLFAVRLGDPSEHW